MFGKKKKPTKKPKKKKIFKGQKGFVNDDGYIEYDGYVRLGLKGDYCTVFDVLIKYGTHNPEVIGWLTKIIPTSAVSKGKIYFALREKGMGKKTEDAILGKKLTARIGTMQNNDESKDVREQTKKELEYTDIAVTRQLSKDESIIDSNLSLVIKSKTIEGLEETVADLRQSYKDDGLKGIMFVRNTSHIKETLLGQFFEISADGWHNAYMETIEANKMFLPSSGFSDEQGVYVGIDMHSFIDDNPSLIDFFGVRNAVIITGGITGKVSVNSLDNAVRVDNIGSAWAHVIAEDNYLTNGRRNHYINLVDFPFYTTDAKVFDMSKYTINPLEVYGTKETVDIDANENFDKVVEMIMMLLGEEQQDPNVRTTLLTQLVDWMEKRAGGSGMYTSDPKNEPTRAWRILATTNHQAYPTISDFVSTELTALEASERKISDTAGEKATTLRKAVLTASKRYGTVFSEKTTVPDRLTASDRNIYYDLSKVSKNDRTIKGAIFLNTLSYAVKRANPGDMLIITGIDTININPKILKYYREVLDRKNVGLIVTFEERKNDKVNVDTLNDFVKPLSNQDLVVLGGMTQDSLKLINHSWSRELPAIVSSELLKNSSSVFYVYRASDFGSAVIDTQLVL